MNRSPRIKLSNGLVVANFSSPHTFTFDDGTIVPACDDARVKGLMLRAEEQETPSAIHQGITEISIKMYLTEEVERQMYMLLGDTEVDIVLVPRVVLDAWKHKHNHPYKFRTPRLKDRVKKINHIDRFCW